MIIHVKFLSGMPTPTQSNQTEKSNMDNLDMVIGIFKFGFSTLSNMTHSIFTGGESNATGKNQIQLQQVLEGSTMSVTFGHIVLSERDCPWERFPGDRLSRRDCPIFMRHHLWHLPSMLTYFFAIQPHSFPIFSNHFSRFEKKPRVTDGWTDVPTQWTDGWTDGQIQPLK